MGFLDSMKGANLNFGLVDSPDFMSCYIAKKGDHFMITGAQAGTYEFEKEDVVSFKVVAGGGTWIKYKITFRDGKSGIITSEVAMQSQKAAISMAPIERFFGDLL